MTELRAGDKAPEFTLPDQDGRMRSLADERGKWVLLYFYPKDMTPGCTKEACTVRDAYASFERRKLIVFGVSTDPVRSHARFAAKHDLPFPILADERKAVVKAYGVWGMKKFMGREFEGTRRMSFLVAPDGRIAKVYEKVRPADHAEEVLGDHEALAG